MEERGMRVSWAKTSSWGQSRKNKEGMETAIKERVSVGQKTGRNAAEFVRQEDDSEVEGGNP